jgi:hypothetical protein
MPVYFDPRSAAKSGTMATIAVLLTIVPVTPYDFRAETETHTRFHGAMIFYSTAI